MKRVFLACGLMFITVAIFAQNLQFGNTKHRFPTMRETDNEATYVFTFENKSSKEVNITGVVCPQKNIRITWDKDTIGKKENGSITIAVNPKNSVGSFDGVITVSTLEKGKAHQYTLRVMGDVLEREKSKQEIYGMKEGNLRYKTNQKSGYKFAPTTILVDTFFFYNEWSDTMTFSYGNLPSAIEILYLTPKVAPLEEGILVFRYNAEMKRDWGNVWDKLMINTNDSERAAKSFYISGEIYDDFASWTSDQMKDAPKVKMSEEEFPFGTVTEGENVEHTFTITNIGKSTLYIRKIKGSCSCTVVQPEKNELAPGESTSMKAIFRTHGKSGKQMRTSDVITNDPERPKITLTLKGNVIKAAPKE